MSLEDTVDRWNEASRKLKRESNVCKAGDDLAHELIETSAELEQLRVQLAGCSVAALGGIHDPNVLATQGMYGWSVTYEDVVALRMKYEELLGEPPYKLVVGNKRSSI